MSHLVYKRRCYLLIVAMCFHSHKYEPFCIDSLPVKSVPISVARNSPAGGGQRPRKESGVKLVEHGPQLLDCLEDGPFTREVPDWHPNPEQLYTKAELSSILNQALQQLTSQYREVFVLCEPEEHSMEEAAQILGLSLAAVKSRLHRARLKLREILEKSFAQAGSVEPILAKSLPGAGDQ